MPTNENLADDDLFNKATSALNQASGILASAQETLSNINSGTGVGASPGPSGTGQGGTNRPGRRIYNPLSKLASYNYQISLYMITPDAYSQFIESGRRKIDALSTAAPVSQGNGIGGGAYLIAQSGGINNKTSKRAPGFELDFYIDNLRFVTQTSTKSTGTSNSAVSDFEFQITEPYGFSFISNLRKAGIALQQYAQSTGYDGDVNVYKQFYIIGIRFYGYDINGNLVTPQTELYGEPIDPVGTDALFENYYDIQISEVKFKLDGKVVVYNIKAAGINGQTLLGTKRGRIPTGATISGTTVDDALRGPNGLFTIMNKNQEDLTKKDPPSQTSANKFNIVYVGDAYDILGKASLVTDSDLDKWRWVGSGAKSSTEATDAKGTLPPDNTARQFTINNDTSIIQAIEQIIKKSTFMESALKTVYSNTTEPDPKQKNNPQIKKQNPTKLTWFNISTEIVSADWDKKLGDWAYETNYVIQLYSIPSIETPYASDTTRYYGPHKRYDYWFTGKNSEVLDFSMNFNNLYFNAVLGIDDKSTASPSAAQNPGAQREGQQTQSGSGSGSSTGNTKTTSGNTGQKADPPVSTERDTSAGTATAGGAVAVKPGLRTGGDKTGSLGVSGEAQNSVTTYLNDAEAYANATIKILGDPDLLIRDATSSIQELYSQFYGSDGFTVNAQGGQVFVEVAFKEAIDYDNTEGIMEINENIFFVNYPPYIKEISKGAVVWMLKEVSSVFNSGKFEQTLSLIGPSFDGMGPVTGPIQTENPSFISTNDQQSIDTKNGGTADDDATAKSTQPATTEGGRE